MSYKKTLTIALSIFVISSISTLAQDHKHHMDHNKSEKADSSKSIDLSKIDKNQDGKVYQCSMCSDQISDKPGECSKCGMKLSEVSVNETNKNMMDHDKMMKEHGETMDHSKMESSIVREGDIDVAAIDKNKDGKVYSCPMCSDVISDEAGRCPKCEMKLKEYSIEDSEKNLDEYQKKQK